jgi:hypothetical protein
VVVVVSKAVKAVQSPSQSMWLTVGERAGGGPPRPRAPGRPGQPELAHGSTHQGVPLPPVFSFAG